MLHYVLTGGITVWYQLQRHGVYKLVSLPPLLRLRVPQVPHRYGKEFINPTVVCLTLRGWRHILNLRGFSTSTAVGKSFIMTLYHY
jgi:hypothetical protein